MTSTLMTNLLNLAPGEGGTFSSHTGEPVTFDFGYMAVHRPAYAAIHLTAQTDPYYIGYMAGIASQTGEYIGAWADPETGHTVVEISTHYDRRDPAERVGRAYDQYSIWDCAAQTEIIL